MKLATFSALGLSLAMTAAACGSGDSNPPDFNNFDDAGSDVSASSSSGGGSGSGSGVSSSGSGSSSGTGSSSGSSSGGSSSGSCGNCTSDSQCQSACPPVQGGGTNCCDTGSGVCYATTQNTCPVPIDAGGPG